MLTDTHVLVYFQKDDSTSIIPMKRMEQKDGLNVGDKCNVTWSNNKKYEGTVMFSGMSN